MKKDPAANHGQFTTPGEVRFVRQLPGSMERVWAYLTDSEKRAKWLAPGQMELRVGGAVELNFRHADFTPEKTPQKYEAKTNCQSVCGRVTRCEPPRLLSYIWSDNSPDASEVTFELTPVGEGVQLVLIHRRLAGQPGLLANVSAGWHAHLDVLLAHFAGAAPVLFWTRHATYESEYAARLKR